MGRLGKLIEALKHQPMSINEISEKFGYSKKTAKWYMKCGFKRMGKSILIEPIDGQEKYRMQ